MKTKLTERCRPAKLNETLTDQFGIEVYYSTDILSAIFYAGNSKKNWWYIKFTSLDKMIERIYKSVDNQIRIETEKIEQKERIKKASKTFKASDYFGTGEIVVNTWGWEQTNVDFYQVIEVLNKKIKVREICSEIVKAIGGISADVTACKDSFLNDKILLLSLKPDVNKTGDVTSCRICNPESYYYFRKWDGRPEYSSWYA